MLEIIKGVAEPTSLYQHCKTCIEDRHCCFRASTIVVLPGEAEKIIEETGRADLLQEEENGLFTIVKELGKPCPFLSPGRLCTIYPYRPVDCKSWPLTLDDPESAGYVVDLGCPAAEASALDSRFIAAAVDMLSAIDPAKRSTFVKLVHRDPLPLQSIELSAEPADND